MALKTTKSIIQTECLCYYCGSPNVDVHHVRLGNCSREKAEAYGLIAYLCREHHMQLHRNEVMKKALQQHAQSQIEKRMSHEKYMEIFKRNYL